MHRNASVLTSDSQIPSFGEHGMLAVQETGQGLCMQRLEDDCRLGAKICKFRMHSYTKLSLACLAVYFRSGLRHKIGREWDEERPDL